jgi:hypothetical protein
MQVSHTLIAAQQAAREAQARFQAQHVASPGFAAALEAAAKPEGFSALPLRQVGTPAPAGPAPQQGAPGARLGTLVDITV